MPGTYKPSMQFYDAPGSRATDEAAREMLGLSGFDLMQRAARNAFDLVLKRYPYIRSLSVWCGKGHNGGDGYLLAALAADMDMDVQVVSMIPGSELEGELAQAWQRMRDSSATEVAFAEDVTPRGELIVDALLGTGFTGEPRGGYARALDLIAASPQPVLCIDVPSGVNASSGSAAANAVQAEHTVTFITRKAGLYTGAGRQHAGRVTFASLGVTEAVYAAPVAQRLEFDVGLLPALRKNTYKHRQGHVVVVGGDQGMPGAVFIAAIAALRTGAGMVTVVTREEHTVALTTRQPEIMVRSEADLKDTLSRADCLVLGPGLGREDWGRAVFEACQRTEVATLLDADGLYHLAENPDWQGGRLFLTPHAAEAARLLNTDAASIEAARFESVQTLRDTFSACALLKGPGSLVCDEQGIALCVHGNPGMASAGMGDALSGVAGGLLASGVRGGEDLVQIFRQAVALHSAAADHAVATVGPRSLIATDVIEALPALLHPRDD